MRQCLVATFCCRQEDGGRVCVERVCIASFALWCEAMECAGCVGSAHVSLVCSGGKHSCVGTMT